MERELLDDRSVILWYRWRQSAAFPEELHDVRINAFGWVDYKHLWFADGNRWPASPPTIAGRYAVSGFP